MDEFEYRIALIRGELAVQRLKTELDREGEEGWELCTTIQTPVAIALVFKRKKKPLISG